VKKTTQIVLVNRGGGRLLPPLKRKAFKLRPTGSKKEIVGTPKRQQSGAPPQSMTEENVKRRRTGESVHNGKTSPRDQKKS